MITQIKITNFRSIHKDTIKFETPLTTVIGPNGTGKTNLILALKFISNCISDTPVRAIQKAGGLDKVFTVKERRTQKCSFEISFSFPEIDDDGNEGEVELPQSIKYEEALYVFELKFDDVTKKLIISREELKAKRYGNLIFDYIFSRIRDGGELESKGLLFEEKHKDDLIFPYGPSNHLFLSLFPRTYMSRKSKYNESIDILSSTLSGISGYNFDPQMIRRSSDLLSSHELSYDGKGFAGIIYRILTNKHYVTRARRGFPKRIDAGKLEENLKSIYEDVLPFLHSFNSSEAMDSTTVDLKFTEEHQVGTSRTFSAVHLSDGTLKFLAVVISILILPDNHVLFIEELENYLNPKAIRRILQIMRDQSEVHGKVFILTTHSETVLNQMKPSEVLVSRRSPTGGTKYTKFREVRSIEEAIDESGISLGTYWGKGGLDVF